jgi:hypothetical protein
MDVSHDKTEIQMRPNQIHQPLLTYLLTPWSRDLPEKLTGPQLLRKFLAFYGTRRFITAFTRACHVFVSSARLYQSRPPSHYSKAHFNIILPFTPASFMWSPSLRFPHQNPVRTSPRHHTCYMPYPSVFIWSSDWYWVSSEHNAPCYVVFSNPPLPRPS